jgi:hypothetical protein
MSRSDRNARSGRRPDVSAQRTINVEVPDAVYWHVRRCAIDSQLSMKDYMATFCQEAKPYPVVQAAA